MEGREGYLTYDTRVWKEPVKVSKKLQKNVIRQGTGTTINFQLFCNGFRVAPIRGQVVLACKMASRSDNAEKSIYGVTF